MRLNDCFGVDWSFLEKYHIHPRIQFENYGPKFSRLSLVWYLVYQDWVQTVKYTCLYNHTFPPEHFVLCIQGRSFFLCCWQCSYYLFCLYMPCQCPLLCVICVGHNCSRHLTDTIQYRHILNMQKPFCDYFYFCFDVVNDFCYSWKYFCHIIMLYVCLLFITVNEQRFHLQNITEE